MIKYKIVVCLVNQPRTELFVYSRTWQVAPLGAVSILSRGYDEANWYEISRNNNRKMQVDYRNFYLYFRERTLYFPGIPYSTTYTPLDRDEVCNIQPVVIPLSLIGRDRVTRARGSTLPSAVNSPAHVTSHDSLIDSLCSCGCGVPVPRSRKIAAAQHHKCAAYLGTALTSFTRTQVYSLCNCKYVKVHTTRSKEPAVTLN
ncbi:hypothetical protein J6590_022239 [Homalodisca vitripennis]|nr:hypothetical protein J6590_022239 [Homalodisca vitripennis]